MTSPSSRRGVEAALPPAGFALLAALTLFWGLNWPGMKIILAELPVWWFRASCVAIGGSMLLGISAASGNRVLPSVRETPLVALCGTFNVFGWHLCSAYGVANMEAGRASIIAFTMPVWAAAFSSFLNAERFTGAKVAGLMLGAGGLAALIGPDIMALQDAPLGASFMLAAALSWGLGTALFKRVGGSLPVASHVGWQLLLSAVPLTVGAALTEPFPDLGTVSHEAWLALAYIYAFPMTFCQWAYFKTVHLFPASIAAIGTLLIPVVGVYSSHLLLGEPVGWREVMALALICAALASVLVLPAIRR